MRAITFATALLVTACGQELQRSAPASSSAERWCRGCPRASYLPPSDDSPPSGTPDAGTPSTEDAVIIDTSPSTEAGIRGVLSAFGFGTTGDDGTTGASLSRDGFALSWATSRPDRQNSFSFGSLLASPASIHEEARVSPAANAWMVRSDSTDFFLFDHNRSLPVPNAGNRFHLAGRKRGEASFAWTLMLDAREVAQLTATSRGDRACVLTYAWPENGWSELGRHDAVVCVAAEGTEAWTRLLDGADPALRGSLILSSAAFADDGTLVLGGYTLGTFEIDGQRFEAEVGAAVLVAFAAQDGAFRWARVVATNGTVTAIARGDADGFTAVVQVDPGHEFRWGAVSAVTPDGLTWTEGRFFVLHGNSAGDATWAFEAGASDGSTLAVASSSNGTILAISPASDLCPRTELRTIAADGAVSSRFLRSESCADDPQPVSLGSLHALPTGEFVAVGNFKGALELGGRRLESKGGWDLFVLTLEL